MNENSLISLERRINRLFVRNFFRLAISSLWQKKGWFLVVMAVFGVWIGYGLLKNGRYGTSSMEFWVDKSKRGEYYEIIESRDTKLAAARMDPFSIVRYFGKGNFFGKQELYDRTPFSATFLQISPQHQNKPFLLKYIANDEVEIQSPDKNQSPVTVKIGEVAKMKDTRIWIQSIPTNTQPVAGTEFEFQMLSEYELFQLFNGGYVIQSLKNTPEKITVYSTDPVPERTTRFLENLMEAVDQVGKRKTILTLQQSIRFLDEQIRILEQEMSKDSAFYRQNASLITKELKVIQNRMWIQAQNEQQLNRVLKKLDLLQQLELKVLEPEKFSLEYKELADDSLDQRLLVSISERSDYAKWFEKTIEAVKEKVKAWVLVVEAEDKRILAELTNSTDLLKVEGTGEPLTLRAIQNWVELTDLKRERLNASKQMQKVASEVTVTEKPFLQKVSYPDLNRALKYLFLALALLVAGVIVIPVFQRRIRSVAQFQLVNSTHLLGNVSRLNGIAKARIKSEILLNLTGKQVVFISLGKEALIMKPIVEEFGKAFFPLLTSRTLPEEEAAAAEKEQTPTDGPVWSFLPELIQNTSMLRLLEEADQIVLTYNAKQTLRDDIDYLEGLMGQYFGDNAVFCLVGEWE